MLIHWLSRNRACSARTLLRNVRTARLVFLSAHKLTSNDANETPNPSILTAGILNRLLSASSASLMSHMLLPPSLTRLAHPTPFLHNRPPTGAGPSRVRAKLAAKRFP